MLASLVVIALLGQQPPAPIKFEPTAGVPTFAVRDPVLRLKPGAIVETRTFSKPATTTNAPEENGREKSGRSTSKGRRPTTRWSFGY